MIHDTMGKWKATDLLCRSKEEILEFVSQAVPSIVVSVDGVGYVVKCFRKQANWPDGFHFRRLAKSDFT